MSSNSKTSWGNSSTLTPSTPHLQTMALRSCDNAENASIYSMEALATTLTLEPGSVANHPAYRILYKPNPTALIAFITHAKSLTCDEAAANTHFTSAILSDEKGDDLSYHIITSNLTKLRMTSSKSSTMTALVASIDNLLSIREQWLQAGVRHFSFDCWYSMVRGYFIKGNDPEMIQLLRAAPESAIENYLRFRAEFSSPHAIMSYKTDLHELRAKYLELHRQLISYKRAMAREHGGIRAIHATIEAHLKALTAKKEEEMEKQREKLIRRRELKERTLGSVIHQIGQLGTMPLDEAVQDVVDDMHEELYQEFVDVVGEKEVDEEERMKEEQWQKEVLGREYNQPDFGVTRVPSP